MLTKYYDDTGYCNKERRAYLIPLLANIQTLADDIIIKIYELKEVCKNTDKRIPPKND